MSQTLHTTATIDFERGIAATCERHDCSSDETLHAFVATGTAGRDGIVVYCHECAELAEAGDAYTYVGDVTSYGSEA